MLRTLDGCANADSHPKVTVICHLALALALALALSLSLSLALALALALTLALALALALALTKVTVMCQLVLEHFAEHGATTRVMVHYTT